MAARPSPPSAAARRARRSPDLEENALLLEAILEKQNNGRLHEAAHYQLQLQQNLIYLATHADERDDIQPLNFQPTHAAGGAPAASAQPPASSRRRAALGRHPVNTASYFMSADYHILRRALLQEGFLVQRRHREREPRLRADPLAAAARGAPRRHRRPGRSRTLNETETRGRSPGGRPRSAAATPAK